MDTPGWVVLGVVAVLFLLLVYGLPTYIAFKRNHEFKWIILAINIVLGASGLGWLIAFVWAVWPQDKTLADPLLGNPTGTGRRNVGHTLGEMQASAAQKRDPLDELEKLGALRAKGVLTEEEFAQEKSRIWSSQR
jgi:hypothetical protein